MDRVADDLVSTATEKQKNHTLYMREYRKRKSEVSLDADRKKDAERKRQYRKREKEAKVAIADSNTKTRIRNVYLDSKREKAAEYMRRYRKRKNPDTKKLKATEYMRQYRKRAKQGIFLNADTERVARSAVANADTNQIMKILEEKKYNDAQREENIPGIKVENAENIEFQVEEGLATGIKIKVEDTLEEQNVNDVQFNESVFSVSSIKVENTQNTEFPVDEEPEMEIQIKDEPIEQSIKVENPLQQNENEEQKIPYKKALRSNPKTLEFTFVDIRKM